MTKPGFAILASPSDGKLIEQILCDYNHPCALIEPDELFGLVRRGEIGVLVVAEVMLERFDHVALRHAIEEQPTWSDLPNLRSEEHTSALKSLMRITYDVFCLQKTTQPLT